MMATNNRPAPPVRQPLLGKLAVTFVMMLVLGISGWLITRASRITKKAEADRRTAEVRGTTAPAPVVVVEKVGKTNRLYRFVDHGGKCVAVELHSDADFYPKGGEVEITPPPPGKPWRDKPGTDRTLPRQEAGTFTVCRVDLDAWGVEIWN